MIKNNAEIIEFLDKCRLDPNEKLTTYDDSWWTLKDLLTHYTEQSSLLSVCCPKGEQLCDHTWKPSDNFSGKEYCSKCPEIRYK